MTSSASRLRLKPVDRNWIGAVPAHWDTALLKLVARLESGHTPSRLVPEYWENCTIPWFTLGDVWQLREKRRKYVSETAEKVSDLGIANSSARVLPAGTVMLSRTASVGFTGIMGCEMATTQDFVNWVCGPKLRPDYLWYCLQAMAPEYDRLRFGSTHHTIYMPDVAQFKVPLPPLQEQEAIASFLDRQTTRIDALIAEKEALLLTLAEHLDSQTSNLLRGGAVAGRKKRTGWRFLEEIPEHWSLAHLRWVARRVDVGIAEAATHAYADTGVPILRSTNIRANRIEGSLLHVEPWFAERNVSKKLFENDLVTVRTGYPGVTAVVPPELDGCQCFTMLITTLQDGYLPEFYSRYLNSAPARAYFEVESWGSAQKNISVPILKDVYVPRLPMHEQLDIAAECRRVEAAASGLAGHITTHIDRLREYRSSLISAAVRGELDMSDSKTWLEERLAA